MLNFPIVPINNYDSALHHIWTSPDWLAFRKELNPWEDPTLERMQTLRFNVLRNVYMRDEVSRKNYWSKLGYIVESLAQAECEMYAAIYADLFSLEMTYVMHTYLDSELEILFAEKPRAIPSTVPDDPTRDGFDWELALRYDVYSSLLPALSHARINANNRLVLTGLSDISMIHTPVRPDQITQHVKWIESHGPLQHSIQSASDTLMHRLAEAIAESNALTGPGAKLRALLVNGDIPLPDDSTFLAWWNMSGVQYFGLDDAAQTAFETMCQFRPTHCMTFVLPCLPMSREHRSGHQLLGDDSHGDHSLSGRSSAHNRTTHGSILHGIWEVTTLLVGSGYTPDSPSRTYLVANERVKDGEGADAAGFAKRHLAMLHHRPIHGWNTGLRYMNRDVFMPGATMDEALIVTGLTRDPWLVNQHPRPFHWPQFGGPFDEGYRSLAKFFRVHLRFDDDEIGALAATEWRTAFVDSAVRYANQNAVDRARTQLDAAIRKSRPIKVVVKSKSGRLAFDLSSLTQPDG